MTDQKIIYTAIFGDYDSLKEPQVITPGWQYICYTDNPNINKSSDGQAQDSAWIIRTVPCLKDKAQQLARFIKINYHLFVDKARQSIWVDASFRINVNLDDWWTEYVHDVMAVIRHPERNCFYKEAEACKRGQKGSVIQIMAQEKAYRDIVAPESGVIQSGILMRRFSQPVIDLCEAWWKETKSQSIRDQLSFCRVCIGLDFIHWIEGYDYDTRQEFIYEGHLPPAKFYPSQP